MGALSYPAGTRAQFLTCLRWVDLGCLGLLGLSLLLYQGAGWSWRAPWGIEVLLLAWGLASVALVLLHRTTRPAQPRSMKRLLGQSIVFILCAPWLLSSVAKPSKGTVYQTPELTVTASPHFSFSFQLNMNESYVGNDVSVFRRRLWLFEQKAGTFYQSPTSPAYAGALPDLATAAGWLKVNTVAYDGEDGLHLTDFTGHDWRVSFE
jgi:hypothetical protein